MRRGHIASTTAGTCSSRRRGRGGEPAGSPTRARSRCTSCGSLPEHLVDALAEPVEAVRGDRLRESGLRDQDVVTAGGNIFEAYAPDLAQLPLDLVPRHGVAGGLRHGQSQTWLSRLVFTVEPVEHEKPRRGRAALPVDGVEVS